jgi:hypothetical protein
VAPKKLPFFKCGMELRNRVDYWLTDFLTLYDYDSQNYQRHIRTRRSRHIYLEV